MELFREHKLLRIQDIIKLNTLMFVHKSLSSLPIHRDFSRLVHSASRRAGHLSLPLCRTSHAQQNVMYRGCKQWNELPEHIINEQNLTSFKNKVKNLFLSSYENPS